MYVDREGFLVTPIRFWKERVLMTCYSSKTEQLLIFTLHFGRDFVDRKFRQKWIVSGGSFTGPCLGQFDFATWRMPFSFHHFPPICQTLAAAPAVTPAVLTNVWTVLNTDKCVRPSLNTNRCRSLSLNTQPTKMHLVFIPAPVTSRAV